MSTGLLLVSAKALNSQPASPSASAILSYAEQHGQRLRVYNAWQYIAKEQPPGVALSIIEDTSGIASDRLQYLSPLPPLTKSELEDLSSLEEGIEPPPRYEYSDIDSEPLPPELQPIAMSDNLPEGDSDDAIQDVDHWDPDLEDLADQKLCPDFDPHWDDDGSTDEEMLKESMRDYDAVDMKNGVTNWSSGDDPEAKYYTQDVVHGWLRADVEDCAKGAQPKLYRRLEISIKPVSHVINSEDYDPSPLSCKSKPFELRAMVERHI